MTKIAAAAELTRLVSHPQDGGFNLPPSAPQVIAAQRTLDKATEAFTRLQEMQQQRASAWQVSSAALSACETLLRDGRPGGTALEDAAVEPPVPTKSEKSVLDQVENRRRRVRELRADLHRIASAPYPSSHVKAKMRSQVEALAARGAPDVSRLIELDGPVEWPTQRVQSEVIAEQRALAFAQVPDTLALVAWLHRDALIKKLDEEIASEADDKAALTHQARRERTDELNLDLLAVERDESALVWQAQAQGALIEHRADCSPLAILQVRLVGTSATNGREPSSWMHAWDLFSPDGDECRSRVGVPFAAPAREARGSSVESGPAPPMTSRRMADLALPQGPPSGLPRTSTGPDLRSHGTSGEPCKRLVNNGNTVL